MYHNVLEQLQIHLHSLEHCTKPHLLSC